MRRLWSVKGPVVAMLLLASVFAYAVTVPMDAENDCWVTVDPGTQANIGPLASNFFGPGSQPIPDPTIVLFVGEPLDPNYVTVSCPQPVHTSIVWVDKHGTPVDPNSVHKVNQQAVVNVDTIVRRKTGVIFSDVGISKQVETELIALQLVSKTPITVCFNPGCTNWEQYEVRVQKDGTQSTGSMSFTPTTLTSTAASGNVHLGTLPINFKITFTRVTNRGYGNATGLLTGMHIEFYDTDASFYTGGVFPPPMMGTWGIILLIAGLAAALILVLRRRPAEAV